MGRKSVHVLGGFNVQRTLEECGRRRTVRENNPSLGLLKVFFCELLLQLDQHGVYESFILGLHAHSQANVPIPGSSKGFGFDFDRL